MQLFAQTSGVQIRRPAKRQLSKVTSMKFSSTNTCSTKTYTVREMNEMGRSFYDKGNYQEAMKWYIKAAEQGIVMAQYNLSVCYL